MRKILIAGGALAALAVVAGGAVLDARAAPERIA